MALKSIDAEWQGFLGMVLPKDASAVQIAETKKAFFAGACAMLAGMREIGEPHVSEDEGVRWYEARQKELHDFYCDLIADHAQRN